MNKGDKIYCIKTIGDCTKDSWYWVSDIREGFKYDEEIPMDKNKSLLRNIRKSVSTKAMGDSLKKLYKIAKMFEDDFAVLDNKGGKHWFGQTGSSECFDTWFVTEEQYDINKRNDKIDKVLDV